MGCSVPGSPPASLATRSVPAPAPLTALALVWKRLLSSSCSVSCSVCYVGLRVACSLPPTPAVLPMGWHGVDSNSEVQALACVILVCVHTRVHVGPPLRKEQSITTDKNSA